MPDKPRQVVEDLQGNPQITPASNPYYLFEYQRPAETEVQRFSGETPLTKLANSLSQIDSSLVQTIPAAYKQYTKAEEAANIANFQQNRDKWATAVRQGTVPVGANPHAARAVHRLMLSELGDEYLSQATSAFQNPAEGPDGDLARAARESSNPQVMRQFLADQQSKFYQANLKNGDKELYNPLDIQEAWQPKMEKVSSELMRAHANYRVSEVERQLRDTVGATISKAVDETFAGFTPQMPDEERKQKYQALGVRISDTLTNKDHGALGTGLPSKQAWDLVTDTVIARALASRDHGREVLETLDYISRPDGPRLMDVAENQRKRLQAEEHLTSLEIQRENHEWALQDRPHTLAAKQHQEQEWAKADERYARERASWVAQDADKAEDEIYRTLSRRVYDGLRRTDSKQGVAVINDAIRTAETVLGPEHVERLRSIADAMTQKRLHVDEDEVAKATMWAKISSNPLSVKPDDITKMVKAKQINAATAFQLQDDLDRNIAHSENPFMRQPEIKDMLSQVARGVLQNPADEFSAEGQMRVFDATTTFRDKAQAWIETHPQGGLAAFREYMRTQVRPILESVNRDYGSMAADEREIDARRGQKIVADTHRHMSTVEQHRERMAPILEAEQQRRAKQQEAKQAEEQRRRDEITNFNRDFKPTGKKTKEGRMVLSDGKGNIASEQTITIHGVPEINNGGITNIPTVFKGKKYSDEQAIDIMKRTKGIDPDTGLQLRRYWSISDATIAAREKSNRIGKEYQDATAKEQEVKKSQPK